MFSLLGSIDVCSLLTQRTRVDYHSPFNPRGDGYQDPSSSSSGAGASIASYPWLDIALGSDTGGSIRGPSEVQGLYGNRPSHGSVSLSGVMPLAPTLDTAGFLTRSPYLWGTAQSVLYGSKYKASYSSYPSKIYAYNYPKNASESPSSAVLVSFLSKLTGFLSADTSAINLTALWASTNPTSTPPLTELLNITYPILISKEQIRLVRDPFYADYAAAHDGRTPFVDPAPLVRWAFGDSYPASALTDAITNKTIFMDWFQSTVLPPTTNGSCSDAFFIYVGSGSGPNEINERNQYFNPPRPPFGFSGKYPCCALLFLSLLRPLSHTLTINCSRPHLCLLRSAGFRVPDRRSAVLQQHHEPRGVSARDDRHPRGKGL